MSRLTLLSTTDAVDPLPLTRLGPPLRHAEERRAALLADPAYRRREAEKAFEQRVHATPDGQRQYSLTAGKPPPKMAGGNVNYASVMSSAAAASGREVVVNYLVQAQRGDPAIEFDDFLRKIDAIPLQPRNISLRVMNALVQAQHGDEYDAAQLRAYIAQAKD